MRKKKEARARDGGWKVRGQRNRNRKKTGRKGIPQGNSLGFGQVNHVPQPDKTVTGIPEQSQATYWLSPHAHVQEKKKTPTTKTKQGPWMRETAGN